MSKPSGHIPMRKIMAEQLRVKQLTEVLARLEELEKLRIHLIIKSGDEMLSNNKWLAKHGLAYSRLLNERRQLKKLLK